MLKNRNSSNHKNFYTTFKAKYCTWHTCYEQATILSEIVEHSYAIMLCSNDPKLHHLISIGFVSWENYITYYAFSLKQKTALPEMLLQRKASKASGRRAFLSIPKNSVSGNPMHTQKGHAQLIRSLHCCSLNHVRVYRWAHCKVQKPWAASPRNSYGLEAVM